MRNQSSWHSVIGVPGNSASGPKSSIVSTQPQFYSAQPAPHAMHSGRVNKRSEPPGSKAAGSAKTSRSRSGRGRGGSVSRSVRGQQPSKKRQPSPTSPALDVKRSLIKVAEAKVDTKVPWGHVLTCGICSETSETASEWGRTVRMKRASPEGGMGDQPVGPACAQHYIFHAKNLAWVDWDRFCTLYHESETFAASVDEGVENMACDAEALEVNYARESVTEEDTQFFEIRAPEAYLLKHGEYLKEFEKDPRKNKSAKSVLVPNLDGTPGTSQYFLADRLGQPPYPTIRAVLCLGAKRARQILEPSEHIFQSQGKLAFEHMNEVRADLHSLGPLWESRGNWEALAGEPVADTAEAPAQPAAGPAASAAAPAPPPMAEASPMQSPPSSEPAAAEARRSFLQKGFAS